eukprot:CAMPEP_0172519342 /NCGR_PEP_ID=MMETSP1066-20121228/291361_1 /TAXON_ID=671091 /ORGANISM="Coscinodiscus wailesii, Strain CCMP2513" /LENGTH=467 /DNA_ID=CAMNT_0013301911 /DNA_START=66 /DNA_END=1470 /DNA_ORIENTATION=-
MAILSSIFCAKRPKSIFWRTCALLAAVGFLFAYLADEDVRRLSLITTEDTKVERHAIAILVPDDDDDLDDLKFSLRSLRKYEIVKKETPIIIFHEESFPVDKKWEIMKWTLNPISFHMADFRFPEGFLSSKDIDKNQVNGAWTYSLMQRFWEPLYGNSFLLSEDIDKNQVNGAWTYSLVQRFWVTALWKHPSVRQFDTIMRIDTDSCFVERGFDVEDLHLPAIRGRYVYRSNGPSTGVDVWIDGLYDFTVDYVEANKITPSHPELWERVKNMWIKESTLPIFRTDFEISRISFFQRRDVRKWHDALTEREPYGVIRNRWGRGRYIYRSNGPSTGVDVWIDGLYDFTVDYVEANKITPSHPELWERVKNMWIEEGTLPVFETNFEIFRVSFFQRRDVMLWHDALTEREPYGVMKNRWGDAQIRVLTMALFGTKDSVEDNVLMKEHQGYRHGKGICAEHFFASGNSHSA